MTWAIDLALLILVTAGALAAFVAAFSGKTFNGKTWRRTDKPLHKRVTQRGRIALACLMSALAFGIIREVRANGDLTEAARRQQELETNLATAAAELQEARTKLAAAESNLTRTAADLQNTRAGLAAVEPNVLEALVLATAGPRRESDHSVTEVTPQPEIPLLSGRTGRALVLYGGDQINYYVTCNDGRTSQSQHRSSFVLKAGEMTYTLQGNGKQTLAGPVGQAMPAVLRNPNGTRGCLVKILIEAADRTREASQLEPLMRMIKEAKVEVAKATDVKAEDPH